ncbi:MAG: hypothetical protein OXC46_05430 [Thaumarchaeota archaeon]|nr:hypothetical protein [Nitrososphaerota archaeon]
MTNHGFMAISRSIKVISHTTRYSDKAHTTQTGSTSHYTPISSHEIQKAA